MREINKIIMHCSKSSPNSSYGFDEIKKDHMAKGWSDIGYHFVIDRSGQIHIGRPLKQIGAHCKGHNSDSIGVCVIGGRNWEYDFTPASLHSAMSLVCILCNCFELSSSSVFGHNELAKIPCPVFSMSIFRADLNDFL